MNPLTEAVTKGTFGELLVQVRLLQFGVQAAPPLKDSGNDLIALKGRVIKAIQVKTTTTREVRCDNLPEFYDLLAVVSLCVGEEQVFLDSSPIFLIPKAEVNRTLRTTDNLERYLLSNVQVDRLFDAT